MFVYKEIHRKPLICFSYPTEGFRFFILGFIIPGVAQCRLIWATAIIHFVKIFSSDHLQTVKCLFKSKALDNFTLISCISFST